MSELGCAAIALAFFGVGFLTALVWSGAVRVKWRDTDPNANDKEE